MSRCGTDGSPLLVVAVSVVADVAGGGLVVALTSRIAAARAKHRIAAAADDTILFWFVRL